MTDTNKTIDKMRRYLNSCDGYQVVDCRDIAVLLDEIKQLSDKFNWINTHCHGTPIIPTIEKDQKIVDDLIKK